MLLPPLAFPEPELKERGLSPRMVQCVHVVLNKALEHAVEEKLILVKPAKKCKNPKNARKVMKILPEALCQAQIVYKMFGMILYSFTACRFSSK